MTSLTQALSVALSGLQVNTALISLASENISNANTQGYSTKTATVTSDQNGSQLAGASIASYSRATDAAVTTSYNTATTAASYLSTQNNYMQQVQEILDSTDSNPTLSADVANFSAAWTQYVSQPESNIQQQTVVNAGRQLANDIQSASTQISALDTQVETDTQTTVNTLNADLKQVATLNAQIQTANSAGLPTGDLEDQRDEAINSVASITGVTVQNRSNGEIALYTPSGQLLVDSGNAVQFTYSTSGTVTDNNGTNVTSSLTGGSLQAELQFRDSSPAAAASTVPGVGVIAKMTSQLSKLVDSFTDSSGNTASAFASAYSAGVTSSTATGATQAGTSVAATFFTVTNNADGTPDPSSFQVNSALIAGTSNLPQTNVQNIADAFTATSNYTASGLVAPNATYSGLTSAILSSFQQTANTISSQSTTATSQQTFYQQTLENKTGVNMDTELANLVNYQNSYAASAHVITTVNQMMQTLLSTVS